MTTPKGGPRKKISVITDESEWENHWLLRVPEPFAERLRKFCEMRQPKERIRIKFNSDQRHGTLHIAATVLHFTVYDLPCIIEIMKTIDKVNLFKINNLSQMLLCTEEPQPVPAIETPPQQQSSSGDMKSLEEIEAEAVEAQLLRQKREKTYYQYPHGVLPPLKNVRKKRFRKTKKKKNMDAPELQKEVKRLLRADLAAARTWYEIETVTDETNETLKKSNQPVSQPQELDEETKQEEAPALLDDLFGDAQRDLFSETSKTLEGFKGEAAPVQLSQKDLLEQLGDISSSDSDDN